VKTAVEYIIRGSSTHVKKTTKIRKYASWIGRKIQVITQKKEATKLDRNDPSFTVRKKALSKPVEEANSATTLFSGRKANGLTAVLAGKRHEMEIVNSEE